jgi:hypothetical protein
MRGISPLTKAVKVAKVYIDGGILRGKGRKTPFGLSVFSGRLHILLGPLTN